MSRIITNMFVPTMFNEAQQLEVIKSGLYPILLSLNCITDNRAKIVAYHYHNENSREAIMSTPNGMKAFNVRLWQGEYIVSTYNHATGGEAYLREEVTSKRPKYITSRVPKLKDHFVRVFDNIDGFFHRLIGYRLENLYQHFTPVKPSIGAHYDVQEWLLMAALESRKLSDAPTHVLNEINRQDKIRKNYDQHKIKSENDIQEFFSKNKFVVGMIPSVGVLVSVINGDQVRQNLNQSRNHSKTIPFEMQPTLYRSLDDVPNDIGERLMASLNFCKLARENNKRCIYGNDDKYKFFPRNASTEVYESTGSISFSTADDVWMMCDYL